jgi:N-methylhydantoinase B/oxoprolinase/acetone carboxylase alpha subunit
LKPGDVIVSDHPRVILELVGGTHLPDIAVLQPAFSFFADRLTPDFDGILPGFMLYHSQELF